MAPPGLECGTLAANLLIQYHICMKMITINVEETTYRRFQEVASRSSRSASELIREAMSEYAERTLPNDVSIFDRSPASVGTIYALPSADDDLLDEMLL